MTGAAIELRDLRKVYRKGREAVHAVDGLDLEVQRGEVFGLLGPNGAGKTTTIRMCLGLTGIDAGSIEAFGLPIPARVREAKARMGVVSQFDSLDPDFTCTENLIVYGRYFGLDRAYLEARVPDNAPVKGSVSDSYV